ncbi:hypothetical protein PITCH_A840035 [uncultured Desulfobacterium sp.]|uniref:Uncharacterized protein n=1 Tax=uncultured Desulfobacterium sp. TaxID=201089 RepID=A0A445N371_9BACT|nr:hypothetical protein PITCH_A840035 [uncultured Desulfobacterium sp.]
MLCFNSLKSKDNLNIKLNTENLKPVNQMAFWENNRASNKCAAYSILTKTDILFEFGIQFWERVFT